MWPEEMGRVEARRDAGLVLRNSYAQHGVEEQKADRVYISIPQYEGVARDDRNEHSALALPNQKPVIVLSHARCNPKAIAAQDGLVACRP